MWHKLYDINIKSLTKLSPTSMWPKYDLIQNEGFFAFGFISIFFENLSPKNVFISWLINYEGVINNGWAIMQILPRRNAKCHNKCIKFNWENHGGFKQKMHIDKRYRTIHIKDLKCRKHFPARAYSIWNYPSVKNI